MYGIDKTFVHSNLIYMLPQLTIWGNMLGLQNPKLEAKFRNTLRNDTRPGCWLMNSLYDEDIVVLVDFADMRYNHKNCVQVYAFQNNITYFEALEKLAKTYIPEKCTLQYYLTNRHLIRTKNEHIRKKKQEIRPMQALWRKQDYEYWMKYGINVASVAEDGVFPVNKYVKDSVVRIPSSRMYWLPTTNNPTKGKLYQPFEKEKHKKWQGTMGISDYWLLKGSKQDGELYITSSYKDAKVLQTSLDTTVLALMNESASISPTILEDIDITKYDTITIFYDSDDAGRTAGYNLMAFLSAISDAYIRIIDTEDEFAKDPSDFVMTYGIADLQELCNG